MKGKGTRQSWQFLWPQTDAIIIFFFRLKGIRFGSETGCGIRLFEDVKRNGIARLDLLWFECFMLYYFQFFLFWRNGDARCGSTFCCCCCCFFRLVASGVHNVWQTMAQLCGSATHTHTPSHEKSSEFLHVPKCFSTDLCGGGGGDTCKPPHDFHIFIFCMRGVRDNARDAPNVCACTTSE